MSKYRIYKGQSTQFTVARTSNTLRVERMYWDAMASTDGNLGNGWKECDGESIRLHGVYLYQILTSEIRLHPNSS
jgi:hypothetical protein